MESIEQLNYIKASKELVYECLSSEAGLKHVWTPKLKVKAQVGFVNEFDFDEGYITKMKVVALEEGSRIVWECIASDEEWVGTHVSFELSENDGKTSVKLIHSGWRLSTDYFCWCSYNWALFLFRLKKHCEELIRIDT